MRMTRLLPTLLLLAAMTTVTATAQNVIRVSEGVNKIDDAVFEAEAGDIIELTTNGGLYREEISVMIDKPITIRSSDSLTVLPTIFTEDGRTIFDQMDDLTRSEERRVGKGGRCRGSRWKRTKRRTGEEVWARL